MSRGAVVRDVSRPALQDGKGCDVLRRRNLGGITASFSVAIIILSSSFSAAANINYKVQKGDSLWEIAKKHSTSVSAIARANGLKEDALLDLGMTLSIPVRETPSESRKDAVQAVSGVKYIHTKANDVCLRSGPSTNNSKIAVLPKGSTGKVLAYSGNWTKVALGDGTCGFVYSPLLSSGTGPVVYSSEKPVTKCSGSDSTADNDSLIQTAMSLRGAVYRRGGTGRGGFDCSGFTRFVFAKYGVSLPHSSAAQSELGQPVSKSELREGDLVFFNCNGRGISHVGIYIGSGQFVHAATYGRGVRVDTLSSTYYGPRYRCARRVK